MDPAIPARAPARLALKSMESLSFVARWGSGDFREQLPYGGR